MPHYSIPVVKSVLCWAEVEHAGSLEDAIQSVKDSIHRCKLDDRDLNEGFEEEFEYDPYEEHFCDEQQVYPECQQKTN